jgi:DNA-binding HxlR family transcriptional regulator
MSMLYFGNYLSCKGEAGTVGVRMETKLPVIIELCNFAGHDASSRMTEMARLRKIITKRGTLEILIPLCCSTKSVRYKQFKKTLKGVSSKTLASRLKELEKRGRI